MTGQVNNIEEFRKNRSAKLIQRAYKGHIDNIVYEKLTDYVWVFQGM